MNKYPYTPPCSKEALENAYRSGMTQDECAIKFATSQKRIWKAMKRFGIKARVAAKRDQRGEKNSCWKGDKAGYAALHRRLYARFGKPSRCAKCGTEDKSRSYDYANLTGNHSDLDDYAPMCRSCHWTFDGKILNIKHMRGRLNNA